MDDSALTNQRSTQSRAPSGNFYVRKDSNISTPKGSSKNLLKFAPKRIDIVPEESGNIGLADVRTSRSSLNVKNTVGSVAQEADLDSSLS